MKILILANNDVGLYKFRKELLERLLKDYEVIFCLPDGGFVKDMANMGCKFIECRLLDQTWNKSCQRTETTILLQKYT